VACYHGPDAAQASRDAFTRVFTERAEPDEMPVLSVVRRLPVLDLVRHAQPDSSNSELRRLIAQGAVQLNGERLADPVEQVTVADGDVLRTGRRTWHRLRVG